MNYKFYFEKLFGHSLLNDNSTGNQLVEVQRRIILKSTVQFALTVISILTMLWGIVDYFAFADRLLTALMLVRLVIVAMMLGLVRYISTKGFVDGFEYLLFIFPQLFFGFSYFLLVQSEYTGFAQAVYIIYENIPFVVMAGIGLMPLKFIKAIVVFLLVLVGTLLAYRWGGGQLLTSEFLAQVWLLTVIGGMAVIISHIQYRMLSSLVNKNITDPLTAAITREAGQLILEFNIAAAKRDQGSLAIAFLDIDHFKQVNDEFGHEAGDEVLINFVKTIMDKKRETDAFVRWGGEEFLLILNGQGKGDPQGLMKRILNDGFGNRPDGAPLTISGGVVDWKLSGAKDCAEFVNMADQRMYEAKEQGRNRILGYWE
jgi:diguanylate cyclase (GGDEF)-like protein